MVYFVIGGLDSCFKTAHAIHAAEYLKKHLNVFDFRATTLMLSEWQTWLEELNKENGWYHTQSPIIFKEIYRRGGKKYLIGGLSEFWEYCYDYYGFQSRMSKTDLEKIIADRDFLAGQSKRTTPLMIGVYGAANERFLDLLVVELDTCFEVEQRKNFQLKLYDKNINEPDVTNDLFETVDNLTLFLKVAFGTVNIALTQEELITNCDLLLVIEDFSKEPSEHEDFWLNRCKSAMLDLADDINRFAKRTLRVVLTNQGPVCFNASVLVEYCTRIRLANIVAVTADEGISVLSSLAEQAKESICNFSCAPVWGFSGICSYVNIESILIKADVYRPYKRALTMRPNSTLPKGEIKQELRLFGNIVFIDKNYFDDLDQRKKKQKNLLGRPPILAKIRATGSLLKLWYAKDIGDAIISLGVRSDGSFGFPPGIAFSQIVALNRDRMWEPLSNVSLYEKTIVKIGEIVQQLQDLFQKFGLGEEIPAN